MKTNTILFVQKELTEQDKEIIRCLDDRRFTVEHMQEMLSGAPDNCEALAAVGFLHAVRCLQVLGSAS